MWRVIGIVIVPLYSARREVRRCVVPETCSCPRIQCFGFCGRSIYPWVDSLSLTDPSLPARIVPSLISWTIDLPSSRGALKCPRAWMYWGGSTAFTLHIYHLWTMVENWKLGDRWWWCILVVGVGVPWSQWELYRRSMYHDRALERRFLKYPVSWSGWGAAGSGKIRMSP